MAPQDVRSDQPVDFVASSLDELGRIPECESTHPTSAEAELALPRPDPGGHVPRCDTAHRELLRNPFPPGA